MNKRLSISELASLHYVRTDTSYRPAPRRARPYFTLVVRDGSASPWGIHFGDYDRETVESEMQDGRDYYAARDMRIIRTPNDKQATIDAAVAKLNCGVRS